MTGPIKHFNIVSNFATWDNVKSTLKQPRASQQWNLQRRTTSNQRYFNVDMNNFRQRGNNVVIFNVEFHNVGQRSK